MTTPWIKLMGGFHELFMEYQNGRIILKMAELRLDTV